MELNSEDALSKLNSSGQGGGCHIPGKALSSTIPGGEMTHQGISARSLPWKQVRGHLREGIVSVEGFGEQQPGWGAEGEKSGVV